MRSGRVPFKFDMTDVLKRMRRIASKRLGNVTLSLPFVSVTVNPKDREKQIAREVVIRLKDRRVLTASECCDNCIDQALNSLQEIRKLLVDKQVELADVRDGPLFLLVDAMTTGIRQFLTFEQHLHAPTQRLIGKPRLGFGRDREMQQAYFDALEILRGHLSRCLGQLCVIADIDVPKGGMIETYQGEWQIGAYKSLILPKQ
jgi:hypothetical protein